MNCLDLPGIIQIGGNGEKILKERAFIYFTRRMATVCPVNTPISLGFGGRPPYWSRVFATMSVLIDKKLGFKLCPSNIGFFAGRFDMYAEAIRVKVNHYHQSWNVGADPLFPTPGTFLPFAMLDDNCTHTCTPGTGPDHAGPGAPRRPNADLIQESFYNGWVHSHGIKHLTCDLVDGIAAFCWGADSIRRNDLFSLSDSQANTHVEQEQSGAPYFPTAAQWKVKSEVLWYTPLLIVSPTHRSFLATFQL